MKLDELRDALAEFIGARLDDREAAGHDAAKWPGGSPEDVLSDITARRHLLAHLRQLANREWSGQYAVQEVAIDAMKALAVPFAGEAGYLPEFRPEWLP